MKNKTKHKNALKYLVVFMPLNKSYYGVMVQEVKISIIFYY